MLDVYISFKIVLQSSENIVKSTIMDT